MIRQNKRASVIDAGSFVLLIFQTECSYYNYLNFAETTEESERAECRPSPGLSGTRGGSRWLATHIHE